MSILVTGIAGSGKSALSEELRGRGETAYDIEKIPGLFQAIHKDTGVTADRFIGDNLQSVQQYHWMCDVDKLRALLDENPTRRAYYCGIAWNLDAIIPFFDKTFLLVASDVETQKRLTNRTSNRYGRTVEVQDWIITWKKELEQGIIEQGAQVVDANQELAKVATDVVARSRG